MSLRDKLHPVDDFWDEKARERAAVRDLDDRIAANQRAIAMVEKMQALTASPGWVPFVKAVQDLRESRRTELELCELPNDQMRIMQGRVRELGSILALMRDGQRNLEGLAAVRKILEDERAERVLDSGQVKPQGVHS